MASLRSILRLANQYDPEGVNLGLDLPEAGPAAPPPAAPAQPAFSPEDLIPEKADPSLIRKLWAGMARGGGASEANVQRVLDPEGAERRMLQRAKAARALYPDDPEAQMLYVMGNDDFLKARAKAHEPQKLGQGELYRDRGEEVYNPKTGVDGGFGYRVDRDGAAQWDEESRPMSQSEKLTMARDEAREEANRVREAQGWARIEAIGRRAAGGGDGAPTPTRVVGRVLDKYMSGEALSEAEQKVLDRYMKGPSGGGMFPGAASDDAPTAPKVSADDLAGLTVPVPRRAPPKPKAKPADTPPVSALQPGKRTRFANGQEWTLENGKPKRLK